MRSFEVRVLLVCFFVAVPFARAAGKDNREKAAKKACLTGKPDKGVEILTDLYLETNDANLIFNQGRCFEQNNKLEEAIGRFREYLRKAKDATLEDRVDAEKHIAECRALLGEKRADELDRAAGVASPAPAAAPAPSVAVPMQPIAPAAPVSPSLPAIAPLQTEPSPAQPASVLVAETAPKPTSHPGLGLRIGGMACAAAGLASIAVGVYYYTEARSYSDKVSMQRPPSPTDQDAGRRAESMQWICYGVGGAAVAAGTVLYVLGALSADSSRSLARIAPMLGRDVAGVLAGGAF